MKKRDKVRRKTYRCRICGAYGVTQIHHIFSGRWRQRSEANDFVIELCPKCHRTAHLSASFGDALKHDVQLEYLETHSLDEWMDLMGKSWIDKEELEQYLNPKKGADIFDD